MDQGYKAFISYRHLPLDIWTAKKLHRRIERYTIPAPLRKDGEKKPGRVFRDQDELPISSNLSANIREALDRAEFLIVICTPETPKSQWVLREISYFLEHHDREHVLAVLADGTPEASFPPQLTERRSEQGDLTEQVEPLAANIVADTRVKRERLFRVESLRILAALLGCPFDALYRRELRYRRRRAGLALGAAGLVAAAFIGMLLNRNAQIRQQLQQSRINESRTLAALSQNAYREGDYSGALRTALRALPGEETERPYVAEAEYALSAALEPYRRGNLSYLQSFEQETGILLLDLSEDGRRLATGDAYGTLRFFNAETGSLLWERQTGGIGALEIMEEQVAVLVSGPGGTAAYAAADGALLWEKAELLGLDLPALAPDHSAALTAGWLASPEGGEDALTLVDLQTGEELRRFPMSDAPGRFCPAAVFSGDGALAAALLVEADGASASLYLLDLNRGETLLLREGLPFSMGATAYRLAFSQEKDLIAAVDDRNGGSQVLCFDGDSGELRFAAPIETEQVAELVNGSASLFASLELLDCQNGRIAVGSKHFLSMLSLKSGEILWQRTLPGALIGGRMYGNAGLALALSDGTVSYCTDDGSLSYSQGIYSFRGGYETDLAVLAGNSYPDGTVALVPNDHPQRAVILRFAEKEGLSPIAERPAEAARLSLIASPSGSLFAALGYDYAYRPREAFLIRTDGEATAPVPLPDGEVWEDPGKVFLTDAGGLIAGGSVLDLRTGERVTLTKNDAACRSARSARDGCVYTAAAETAEGKTVLRVWKDGELLCAEECPAGRAFTCEALGGNGWVLLRETEGGAYAAFSAADGTWTAPPLPADGSGFALGEERAVLALRDGEGQLHLVDLLSGGDRVAPQPLPAATVKLAFAPGDAALAAFSQVGTLELRDAGEGALLMRADFGALDPRFSDSRARYAFCTAPDGRLLLLYDRLEANEALCLAIDTRSWERSGAYVGVAAYDPAEDCFLTAPYLDKVYRGQRQSLEELIRQGEAICAESAPGD